MLRCILGLCVSLIAPSAVAQKIISYHTFTQPITVKEATTFVKCRFEALPFNPAVLVDQNSRATFDQCIFEGSGWGIGIETFGDLSITHCTFTGLGIGLSLKAPVHATLQSNVFSGNITALFCNTQNPNEALNMSLTCNRFELGNLEKSFTSYGIRIEQGTVLQTLGGDFSIINPKMPNGNSWPVADPSQPFFNWESPNGWESIDNRSSFDLEYWKFENEFISHKVSENVLLMPTEYNAYSATQAPDLILSGVHVAHCDHVPAYAFPNLRQATTAINPSK